MSKKSRKRNKKILAALALAGGAAMLARGRGKGTGAVSTAGQAVGVDRITPKSNWISKKVVPDVVAEPAATVRREPIGKMSVAGIPGQDKRALYAKQARIDAVNTAEGPPSIDNPYRAPRQHLRFQSKGGRINAKGGGIAKRGTGVALKHGGRVKSMGIAKRGGGIAKK
jgi:hypothetical protein